MLLCPMYKKRRKGAEEDFRALASCRLHHVITSCHLHHVICVSFVFSQCQCRQTSAAWLRMQYMVLYTCDSTKKRLLMTVGRGILSCNQEFSVQLPTVGRFFHAIRKIQAFRLLLRNQLSTECALCTSMADILLVNRHSPSSIL